LLAEKSDIFFSIGTSAEVFPVAELPLVAKRAGATLIEINPERTILSEYVDLRLELTSGLAMPMIIDEFKKRLG